MSAGAQLTRGGIIAVRRGHVGIVPGWTLPAALRLRLRGEARVRLAALLRAPIVRGGGG